MILIFIMGLIYCSKSDFVSTLDLFAFFFLIIFAKHPITTIADKIIIITTTIIIA